MHHRVSAHFRPSDMEVSLSGSATVLFGASAVISYDITNNGTLDATNVVADVHIARQPDPGLCQHIGWHLHKQCAGTVNCALGDVPGMSNRTRRYYDNANRPSGPGMISATVCHRHTDERPGNNQEALQLTVDPAVDLVVNAPTGSVPRSGSTRARQSMSTLENRATMDATAVTLTVDLGNALQATAANWSIGSCTVPCPTGDLPGGDLRGAVKFDNQMLLLLASLGGQTDRITVTLSAVRRLTLYRRITAVAVRIEVKDPDDSSGGGATGPWFLCLLAGLIGVRRNRRRTA